MPRLMNGKNRSKLDKYNEKMSFKMREQDAIVDLTIAVFWGICGKNRKRSEIKAECTPKDF